MEISEIRRNVSTGYVAGLRQVIGTRLALLPAAAGAVFDADGRLLLGRQRDGGLWDLVGGCIEVDESPNVAVTREMAEETGLKVAARSLIGCYGGPEFRVTYSNGDHAAFVVSLFHCEILDASDPTRDGELIDLAYIALDGLPALHMRPSGARLAKEAFRWANAATE
ncbi:NUDIX domain-containing protein [Paenarthrobacter sp. CM16]|uniref:NUDIX domain-containing protein n=1 Tax=Paenarthrobacter sp. CM16 TaxID=2738447 RepID=UPI001552D403|nr:NUDIX domain-containing protein [Paenarthrobacter sp. CM16]NQD90424.1 NUDIX domain-containing protein [Paenarthrobacter sp. CM16]